MAKKKAKKKATKKPGRLRMVKPSLEVRTEQKRQELIVLFTATLLSRSNTKTESTASLVRGASEAADAVLKRLIKSWKKEAELRAAN